MENVSGPRNAVEARNMVVSMLLNCLESTDQHLSVQVWTQGQRNRIARAREEMKIRLTKLIKQPPAPNPQ